MQIYTLEEYAKLKKKKNGLNNVTTLDNQKLGNKEIISLEENARRKNKEVTNSILGLTDDIAPVKDTLIYGAPRIAESLEDMMKVYSNDDFKEKSGYTSTKSDKFFEKLGSKYGMGYTDLQYEYINNKNDIRKEIDRKAVTWSSDTGDKSASFKDKAFEYMTQEEVDVYNYYYKTEGKEKADKFLNALAETLSNRKAGVKFEGIQGKTAREILYGTVAGTEQFKQGIKNVGNMVVGKDDYIPLTSEQVLSNKIREDLEDNGTKILGSSLGQIGYDMVTTGANMIPAMATGNPLLGATVMGASASGNAYQQDLNETGDKDKAKKYATAVGVSEAVLQHFLGGIGKLGGTSKMINNAVAGVKNGALRFALEYGGKIGSESLEEGLQEVLNPVIKNAVYGTDEKINWEEVTYSALMGGVMGGVFGLSEATSTHLNTNEHSVVEKEIENRIKAKETDDKKLTKRDKDKIREQVMSDLEKGRIDTDEIGKMFAEDSYNEYMESAKKEEADLEKPKAKLSELKNELKSLKAEREQLKDFPNVQKAVDKTIKRTNGKILTLEKQIESIKNNSGRLQLQNKMDTEAFEKLKGTRLAESYHEKARRGQSIEVDIESYDNERARKTAQNFIDYGANNSTMSHDFLDLTTKLAKEGEYTYNFMTSKQLEESVEKGNPYGITEDADKVEAFVNENAKEIVIVMDSNKSLSSLVGHEVTHTLEKASFYESVKGVAINLAKIRGEYDSRWESIQRRYKNYTEEQQMQELVSDLIGDYLFGDTEFVRNLSTEDKNAFQKVYDEIKHILKLATAGSKEARELERLKKEFEKVWRESSKGNSNATKYSIVESFVDNNGTEFDNAVLLDTDYFEGTSPRNWGKVLKKYLEQRTAESTFIMPITDENGDVQKLEFAKRNDYVSKDNGKQHPVLGKLYSTTDNISKLSTIHVDEIVEISGEDNPYYSGNNNHGWLDKNGWLHRTANVINKNNGNIYQIELDIAKAEDGRIILYALSGKTKKVGNADVNSLVKRGSSLNSNFNDSITETQENASKNVEYKVTDSGSVTKYSLATWTEETKTKAKNNLIKAGHDAHKVEKWINDVNSIASVIASDKARLDFEAVDNQTMLKNNQEYVKTLDASTLCAKRLVYQGTFDAIQHRLPNTMLSSDDLIGLLNMMKEHGVQTPCGVCYVESRRRHLGKFAQEWLDGYEGGYIPNLDEVTTSDGLEALRKSHPETYNDFVEAMNKKGSSNPKVVQLRTEYRNEILSLTPSQIKKIDAIGGLRVQSFSDFETPHLLDMMQAVMDMSSKGLTSQAYTKVPNFAWVFGDTGIKINLSLIAEGDGFDADGNLAFSSTEGMDINDAMALRDAYSENVGTIIVGANDKHILACMQDDRIDYIIPFHRSGWGSRELELMGMDSYEDYTYGQKEHFLDQPAKVVNGVQQYKGVKENLYPPDYWDYNVSGKENAERYLRLCAQSGREPKFSNFLVNNGDGSYSLQPDGSTDGYWKTLIDFKMYDNDGNGAKQQKVQPNFNMEEAYRVLNEYEGGANKLPVAHDVVEEFVAKYESNVATTKNRLADDGKYSSKEYGNHIYSKDVDVEENGLAPLVQSKKTKDTKVAQILKEAPVVERDEESAFDVFMEKLVDKGYVFEKLSKKTKNRELEAKYNFIRYADRMAQDFIGKGKGDIKALNDIVKEVESKGLDHELNKYMYHMHNIDRMSLESRYGIGNKAVYGETITSDISRKLVAEIEAKYPEFKQYAEELYKINRHLRNMLVEGDVISQETADLWEEMYPHYVPIKRSNSSGANVNVPLQTGRTGINAPIKRAVGGSSDIEPLFGTMAERVLQTYKAVAKNKFGIELKNTLDSVVEKQKVDMDTVLDGMAQHEELLQEGKNGQKPTFTIFENGERVTFEVDELMYEALKPTDRHLAKTYKIPSAISNFHRNVVTQYNPSFMIRNPIKDTQDVLINSQHPAKTFRNFPKAIDQIIKNGEWNQEYDSNGGEYNTYFDRDSKKFAEGKSKLAKIVGFPLDKISAINEAIEKLPRLAEYIASREEGRSIEVSMLDAARVTTNFSAGADFTKFLNRNGATFLNASVQGAMQTYRNFTEAKMEGAKGWVKLATKCAVAGIPLMVFNNLMWDDDEEYDDLSDYVKQNYYVVAKFGDGEFVRIPKGRTLSVIQNAFEQITNALTGNGEVDFETFAELVISNLAPNNPVENNIIAPIIQVKNNETWYGEDLVPSRLQDVPEAEQFDESTDSFSKWLGEKIDYSPYKINYLIDQYSGAIGDTFLPMLTPEAESGDDGVFGKLTAPLRSAFTTDSVLNNQNVSDFYEKKDELTVNANKSSATDEDTISRKYFDSVNSEIGKLYGEKRNVQNSNLSDSEKYYLIRDIQKKINRLSKKALEEYDDVSINNGYATVGDKQYRRTDDGWEKLNSDQIKKQNEVTSNLDIAPEVYWSNKDEYEYAYENPEKYAVAKAIGGYDTYSSYKKEINAIKGDDAKAQKRTYIFSLNMDYGQKAILYRSMYGNKDDKNEFDNYIVNYLNSRNDLSDEEKRAILNGLK